MSSAIHQSRRQEKQEGQKTYRWQHVLHGRWQHVLHPLSSFDALVLTGGTPKRNRRVSWRLWMKSGVFGNLAHPTARRWRAWITGHSETGVYRRAGTDITP
jgi:hypothetical protein